MSGPKNKKDAPAGEAESQRQPRKKEKMIRLEDLIPKNNVVGGRKLLFGASEPTTNNPIEES